MQNNFRPCSGRSLIAFFLITLMLFAGSLCTAQSVPNHAPVAAWSNDLSKYPGLLPEFAHLVDKIQHNVQFPPPRAQSHILPVLPESNVFYAAFPNYGEASHQALDIFHQELQESPVLHDWWQHLDDSGVKNFEDFAQKFYSLSQYLGDEIVISGSIKGKEPSFMVVAQVRKPGLKEFLQQMIAKIPATPKPPLRILDPQELASAKDVPHGQPIILVRSDFLIVAGDLATLRSLNTRLTQHSANSLASTSFGQRIVHAYDGSVNVMAAADIHAILNLIPKSDEQKTKEVAFQRSGFSEMKYLVWERKTIAGRDISQGELSFNGPRQGAAAWLAAPRQLRSLEFLSPHAIIALSVALTEPAQIFDDLQEMASSSASPSNPNPLVMAAPMAQMIGINLKDDLLNLLTGELAFELDSAAPPPPAWRLVLGANDPAHFQKTLTTLFAASHLEPQRSQGQGVTYYTLNVPSPANATEISYAFVNNYLVAASSRDALVEAIHMHQQGGSLAKSQEFLSSLPPGHDSSLSALFYEDPSAMMSMSLAQAAPEMRDSLSAMLQGKPPVVVGVYGDQDAIREATAGWGLDPTTMLLGSAIAVPNLLRARISANEASAVATLRMVDAAEVTYSAGYPQRGFAPNLATLGSDPDAPGSATVNHAGLMDETLGNPSCTATNWCERSGYRFRVAAECRQKMCQEFVAVATPVSNSTGGRNFCSTSDGVIHFKLGPALTTPATASECKAWEPLQ